MSGKHQAARLAVTLSAGVSLGQDAPVPDAYFPLGDAKLANVVASDDTNGTDLPPTLGGAAALTTDRFEQKNGAIEFIKDAASYFSVPLAKIQGLDEFTVAAWINPDRDYMGIYQCLMSMLTDGNAQTFVCLGGDKPGPMPADNDARWFMKSTAGYLKGRGELVTVPRGEWSHISISKTAAGILTLKRHVPRGQEGGGVMRSWDTTTKSGQGPIPDVVHGGMVFGTEIFAAPLKTRSSFVGLMDDIMVFPRVLTDGEMLLIEYWQPATPLPIAPPTLSPAEKSSDDADDTKSRNILIAVGSAIIGLLLCLVVVAFVVTRRATGSTGNAKSGSATSGSIAAPLAVAPLAVDAPPVAADEPMVFEVDMDDL